MDAEISTQLYVVGTADTVLIREVSLIKSVLYREVPLYCHPTQKCHTCNFWLSQVLTGVAFLQYLHIVTVCALFHWPTILNQMF